jgi:hypothetical protein
VYNGLTLAPLIKLWVKGAEAVAAELLAKNPMATAATPAPTAAPTTSPTTKPTLEPPARAAEEPKLAVASRGAVVWTVVAVVEVDVVAVVEVDVVAVVEVDGVDVRGVVLVVDEEVVEEGVVVVRRQ